ncbi:MAG TPA: SMP-30/gluconolactonase/LRE family protein [Nitrospirales bacterium]|nr:SMP-30/gluconolactonase/LRE family protein [Nitrospirales bacterium]
MMYPHTISRFILVVLVMSVCMVEEVQSSSLCQSPGFPRWTFDQSHIFPQDRPLARPEDGKALPDGRLVVADERFGLYLIEPNNSHRPFGRFSEVGYVHTPPDPAGGVQAVFLEHDTRHLLVGDIYSGKIYRVNTQTEETRLIYDHPYGVNSVYRDRNGTIWFTQSTNNIEARGKEDLWASVNLPVPTGAVFKLPGSGEGFAEKAEEVANNLYFANGITFDKTEKYMYVSESMMDRVLRFRVDVESGSVSESEVYQNVYVPDNLAVDSDNNLWIASFVGNKVMVVDNICRAVHTVFQATSTSHSDFLKEWTKRSHLGQPRNEVLTPEAFNPLPNFLTGLFFSPNFDTVYFTGLGNAILAYAMSTGR